MILSNDHLMFDAEGKYIWTPFRCTVAHQWNVQTARGLLPRFREMVLLCGLPGAGKSTWLSKFQDPEVLYVDNTFATKDARQAYIALAQRAGKPIKLVWLQTPMEVCLARNALRTPDRQVPQEAYEKMQAALTECPPSIEEGFQDVILYV
jgi:predicted kinase